MADDDLAMPYKIAPGTPVRIESLYEGDNRLLGAMGLMISPWPTRRPARAAARTACTASRATATALWTVRNCCAVRCCPCGFAALGPGSGTEDASP